MKAIENRIDGAADLASRIKEWAGQLGFSGAGISDTNLAAAELHLLNWLKDGFHGEMDYMRRHGTRRARPADLVEGTIRVISVMMEYKPEDETAIQACLDSPDRAFVSRYALGADYHKLMRRRLQQLADRIEHAHGRFGYRAFVDSAPVLEKALAEKAGLGWIGKHSNLLNKRLGSWFFIGELYTDLPLPVDPPAVNHCGTCRRCIDACPTGAIVGPYRVDARKCISYLTIELQGPIPEPLRGAIGNRIFGCDDCQLVCPFNGFSELAGETRFRPRHDLDRATLQTLFGWTAQEFEQRTRGSAIRRIGYRRWTRNIAVALGNAPPSARTIGLLLGRRGELGPMVDEHIDWAVHRQRLRLEGSRESTD